MSVSSSPRSDGVPVRAIVGGALLFASAFLPLHPQGPSFFDLWLIELSRGVLYGLLMLAGLGSPFVFGAAVVGAPWLGSRAAGVLRIPVALMHSQLVLVAIVLVSSGAAVASWALLGFSVASGIGLALHSARARAEEPGPGEDASADPAPRPSARWFARWGAMVVAGVAGWCELQRAGEIVLGYGLHVALVGALALLVLVPSATVQEPTPSRD